LECLEPLKKFPTNAVLQTAAERLFGQTNFAWGRLPWKNNFGWATVDSELVAIPAYRTLLCRELGKTDTCEAFSEPPMAGRQRGELAELTR
jgi:hypothetical protein